MQVWDGIANGSIHFTASSLGEPVLGHMVENNVLLKALSSRLLELQNKNENIHFMNDKVKSIELRSPTLVPECRPYTENISSSSSSSSSIPKNRATLTLDDNSIISTKLIIGADGNRSRIRDMSGLPTAQIGYDQRAVVTTVKTTESHSTAFQRFLPTGPIAMLPVSSSHSNIVWSTTADHAQYLMDLDAEQFRDAINYAFHGDFNHSSSSSIKNQNNNNNNTNSNDHHYNQPLKSPFDTFGNIMNSLQSVLSSTSSTPSPPIIESVAYDGHRGAFPLQSIHATQYVKEHVALVGDAAHTIHPLAGQGVNIGLADVAALTRTLMMSGETGADLGSMMMLKRYEDERSMRNAMMMMLMDGVYRMFTTDGTAWHSARSLGMNVVNGLAPVKNMMTEFAMGKDVDISRIGSK